jgi:hypothetical protein
METLSSRQYHEMGKGYADLTRFTEKKDPEIERIIQREKMLSKIEAATGIKFDVITKHDSSNEKAAAMVETGSKKAYVSEKTLDSDLNWALYAAHHERNHLKNGIFEINPNKYLSYDHAALVAESIGLDDLMEVDLMEGFNDLITIGEKGKHQNSGYLKKDVPAAEKLEDLALEHTGESLLEAFKSGNLAMFYYRFKKLADCLLLLEAAGKREAQMRWIAKNKIQVFDVQKLVRERLSRTHISVTNTDDARDMVNKIMDEERQIELARRRLAA